MHCSKQKSHLFSVYCDELSEGSEDKLIIRDRELISRLRNVLRVRENQEIFLFNKEESVKAKVLLSGSNRNSIECRILERFPISVVQPKITLLAPLVKKSALEKIVFYASQIGVWKIVPFFSSNFHRKILDNKEIDRLKRIAISGCEESKQFCLPKIDNLISFDGLISKVGRGNEEKVFFEVGQQGASKIFYDNKLSDKGFLFAIGPEGGFSEEEIRMMISNGFKGYQMGGYAFRSENASFLAMGILRIFLDG